MTPALRAVAFALGGAVLYGIVPVFASGAFRQGIPAFESTFVRTGLIALVFTGLAVALKLPLMIPQHLGRSFLYQALSTLVVSVCYLASVQFIPVGLAVIIFFTFPVLIVLLSVVVEKRAPNILQIICVLVAFAGLAVALGTSFSGIDWRGIALAIAAALGAVMQSFTGRDLAGQVSPLVFGGLVHMSILPFTFAIAFLGGNGELALLTSHLLTPLSLFYLLGLSGVYIVAYFLHMQALRIAPASTVMPFFNLEPIVSTGVAAMLFGERLSIQQYGGGSLVLAALLLVGLTKKRENKPS